MKSQFYALLPFHFEEKNNHHTGILFSYEDKTVIYDILLYRNGDELKERFRKNSRDVHGIEVGILAKMLPAYEKVKPVFEAYLNSKDDVLFEGETLSKNDIWWKIKEKMETLNNPKKKTSVSLKP